MKLEIKRQFYTLSFIAILSLYSRGSYAQKYEILYMQFDPVHIDTTLHEVPPFHENTDTLAKWIVTYSKGKTLIKQTDDTPYERHTYYLNKQTRQFDEFTFYNMSKNEVYYNDYIQKRTRHIAYFFDLKYVIDDSLPKYNWVRDGERKKILSYNCKHAIARNPVDRSLVFDVWYTEEVPVPCGPFDLNGLPGLILQVDRNGDRFYEVISVKKLPEKLNLEIKVSNHLNL